MKKPTTTPATVTNPLVAEAATYIGIDFHKKYSVFHAIDAAGKDLGKGRIDHNQPEAFADLMKRWPMPRVVFECSMNWHWLFETLERSLPSEHITVANSFKIRIIAEAQVKTDKVDARILALLLRADMVSPIHIPAKATRERKEVLRQRCFFVRQRTMLRNRVHRLLSGQHGLQLPQVSDLFGNKGLSIFREIRTTITCRTLTQAAARDAQKPSIEDQGRRVGLGKNDGEHK